MNAPVALPFLIPPAERLRGEREFAHVGTSALIGA
jgi:hypothetical protein